MAFVGAAVGDRGALLLRRPRSPCGAPLPAVGRSVGGRPGTAPVARILCLAQPAGDRRPARAFATGPAWLAAAAAAAAPWARSATAAALAAALVLSPAALPTLQVGDATLTGGGAAHAARGGGYSLEAASGEVNKDGESVLRWALPINNKAVRELQSSLESITADLRGLKWGKVEGDARKAVGVAKNQREKILAGVPADRRAYAEAQLDVVTDGLPQLNALIAERSTEKVVGLQRSLLRNIGNVEESMVVGFPFEVPAEYADKPLLKGRATVEMTIRKAGDEDFDIMGTIYKEGKLTMVLDGYTAPVSAGNFVDLVQRGFYNNDSVVRSDGFVVQIGRPDTKDELYVDPDTGLKRTIPLEVFAKGDKQPTYGLTLEDDGRGYAATKLPFSVNGALAQARNEFEANTGSSQVFWFLFEPDLTPAGRNLLDGRYALFGYVIDGDYFLKSFGVGDKVIEAKVVDGLENLVLPGKQAS